MPLRSDLLDPLLAPISDEAPSGTAVRDEPVWEQIREARREELDVDQGDWQRARKVAEPALVLKLATPLLAERTKDLQLAAWWTEAMLRRDGLAGLRDGVALLDGLLARFWETLHPEIEDGDASLRAGPLDFVALKLLDHVRATSVDRAGHTLFQYEAAALAGDERAAAQDDGRAEARAALAERDQPLLDTILESVATTPKAWYREQLAVIDETIATLHALSARCDALLADEAPNWARLVDVLSSAQRVHTALLAKRLETDPDPVDEEAGDAADAAGTVTAAVDDGPMAPVPTSAADAEQRVIASARFLRKANLADPVPYALLRALRWQPLRAATAGDGAPPPELLHAPTTAERAKLKQLALAQRHEAVLEGVEELVARVPGAAWLDAQRFALDATLALGPDVAPVHHALRTALRQLLADCPRLPHAMLLDDSPVANAETVAWLERDGYLSQASELAPLEGLPPTSRRPLLERARAEAAGGRLDRGIAVLMADLARERSERARFLRRVELLTMLVEAGRADVAMPLVEQMLGSVDEHKLDDWEDGDVVARALVLACRAIDATDGDRRQRDALYERICRLDPVAALALGS
jgi:type VI secretion system protein ImpA